MKAILRFIPVLLMMFMVFFHFSTFGKNKKRKDEVYYKYKKIIHTEVEEAEELFREGYHILRKGFVDSAMHIFKNCLALDENFLEANYYCGKILFSKNPKEAIGYYITLVDHPENVNYEVIYDLGMYYYVRVKDYKKAVEYFDKYMSMRIMPNFFNSPRRNVSKLISFKSKAETILRMRSNPVAFDYQNLGDKINSKYDEYLPAFTIGEKKIFFTRRTPVGLLIETSEGIKRIEYTFSDTIVSLSDTTLSLPEGSRIIDTLYDENFYEAEYSNKQWSEATMMPKPLSSKYREGAHTLSPNGKTIYYTICDKPDGYGSCDIYISQSKNGRWSAPKNLGGTINTEFWESQPYISPDGIVLYFVSNRPKGFGGLDIWKSEKNRNGVWSEVKNLGLNVNTPKNEQSPFLHFDLSTMFFASDGHEGLGGLDIFRTQHVKGKWTFPENLGYPINDAYDQGSVFVSVNSVDAYYSTNRIGTVGKNDIVKFELPVKMRPKNVFLVEGTVTDEETGMPIEARIFIKNLVSNDSYVLNTNIPDADFGIGLFKDQTYSINATAVGYLFYSEKLHTNMKKWEQNKPYELHLKLRKIKIGRKITLNNIFFKSGFSELSDESLTELEEFLRVFETNPKVAIQFSGHTDNLGSASSNLKLSTQRAKAVYDFFLEKGVNPKRLSYKGYGSSRPVASNKTDEGRAKNRRSEARVFEILK